MPSPLGHALGGFAAGWLVAGPSRAVDDVSPSRRGSWWRRLPRRALAFGALGMVADLDLLIGRHSQFTHSIGMTIAVALGAYAALRLSHCTRGAQNALGAQRAPCAPPAVHHCAVVWLALAVGAAYGSHILLDWLAQDATPPRGITALWPFSSTYYLSGLDLFWGISREPWRPGVVLHDALAISRELVLLGPPAAATWWLRRRTGRQILPRRARTGRQPLPPDPRLPASGESR